MIRLEHSADSSHRCSILPAVDVITSFVFRQDVEKGIMHSLTEYSTHQATSAPTVVLPNTTRSLQISPEICMRAS